MHDIRIIVLNYQRPDNVDKIVSAYKNHFPITVINNNPTEHYPYVGQPVDVINNDKNYFCMERWVRCFEYDEPYKLVLDDDIMVSPKDILKMRNLEETAVGIYGKSGVANANSYEELKDHWSHQSEVDFLVGAAILVKQDDLNKVKDKIIKAGYPERGDDIIVSYLLKKYCNCVLKTTEAKILNLPEGSVGLNKDPNHFLKRWNVIQKFKNLTW